MLIRILIFLVLNFAALGIGSIFTSTGTVSDWYLNMNKAPWTPPGWVFGFAWTTIMICFAVFMAYLWPEVEDKKTLTALYVLQWVLNVIWNPLFFHFQLPAIALVSIVLLTIMVAILTFSYTDELGWKIAFILPYLIWLCIAVSLNGYFVFNN